MITPEQIEYEIQDLVNRGHSEQAAVAIVAARYPDLIIEVETTTTTEVVEEVFESSDDWYDSGCSDYWEDSSC